jgi:lysozyme|tara:strand:+ start:141 stop:593 length:453 start_codon:yes stop_codon:yes gene_type:complete
MLARKTSGEGVALIRKFEGCEFQAYQCSASVWTLGYGHTRDVSEGDTCTKDEAEQTLISDLEEFEGYVNDLVKTPLEQNQFDALVAWTFNLGPTNLRSSTLLARLNDGDLDDVPHQLRRWNKAGGKVLDGLVRRREAEALLWLGDEWSHV